MGKHLGMKAFVLLIVIFFHSFVLVPKANASGYEAVVAKAFYEAVAPAVVAATPAGRGYLLALAVGSAVIYIAVKSGAVTALKNWVNGVVNPPVTLNTATYGNTFYYSNANWEDRLQANSNGTFTLYRRLRGSNNEWTYQGSFTQAQAQALLDAREVVAVPSVPTDYSAALATTQPSLNTSDVFGSQGFMPWLLGGTAQLVKATQMPDGDLDKMKEVLGLTSPDHTTGVQPKPNLNDNTLTPEANQSIPLLQQMVNFLSNLLGVKADTAKMAASLDNAAVAANIANTARIAQKATLDNIAALTQAQKSNLDNIAVGVANQTALQTAANAKLDNATAALRSIDNAVAGLSTSTATLSTLSSRIASLQSVLSTKFPFSLAGSLSVSAVAGASTYVFTSLQLAPGIEVPIDPMAGPLGSLLTWARQMVVYLFWVGTLLAILHRGMSM